jgi:hypothetical protein
MLIITCFKKNNEDARKYYLNTKSQYKHCCGPYIYLPCCCGYGFYFELLFLRDKSNGDFMFNIWM